jgi:hypothetical protein
MTSGAADFSLVGSHVPSCHFHLQLPAATFSCVHQAQALDI